MYVYFVSYQFNNGRMSGFGNCEVGRRTPLRNISDAKALASEIGQQQGLGNVVILSFQLFEQQ